MHVDLSVAVAVVSLHALFALAGSPIVALWRGASLPVRIATAPVFGMGATTIASWYWSRSGVGGLGLLSRPLILALSLGGVFLWLRTRGLVSQTRRVSVKPVALAGGLSLLVIIWIVSPVVRLGYTTSIATVNADIANYALASEHLVDRPISDPGPISNVDLGLIARNDVFGTCALLALSSGLLGQEVWRITLPVVALVWINVATLLSIFLWRRLRVPAFASITIGIAATASSLFVYTAANFYLSQLLGLAFVLLGLLVVTEAHVRRGDLRPRRMTGSIVLLSIPLMGLLLAYPTWLPGLAILFVSLLGGALGRKRAVARITSLAAISIGAAVLSALLLQERVSGALTVLGAQSSGTFGLGLIGITPEVLLGLESLPAYPRGLYLATNGIVSLAAGAGALLAVLRRRPYAREMVLLLSAVGMVWLYLAWSRGSTAYVSWKWLSYFQPLVAGLVVGLGVNAVRRALRWSPRHHVHSGPVIATALGALLVVSATNGRSVLRHFETRPAETATPVGDGWRVVDSPMIDLETNPALDSLQSINVNLPPYWEAMWDAYFLRRIQRVNIIVPTYYAPAPPSPGWTLQRADLTPVIPGVTRIVLNERYILVDTPSAPVA